MNTDPKTANSIGGKTARACDSCLRKRARFFCASDDAFLCQNCDSSVHSANQLASRHERIRLGTASFKSFKSKTLDDKPVPAWHKWLTRKARTPRHPKPASGQQFKDEVKTSNTFPLVPEIGSEDDLFEETEAQLLYRVPVFDPLDAELCNLSNESEGKRTEAIIQNETNILFSASGNDEACELENFLVYLPSDMELAMGFADVNSLFGTRFDEESHRIEGLGLIDCEENVDNCYEGSRVKVEDEEKDHFHSGLDISKETLDWDFHNESPVTGEEEEEEKVVVVAAEMEMTHSESEESRRKEKFLRLNYEEVISAWDNQGCPWTSGIRPEFNLDEGWPEFMGTYAAGGYDQLYGGSRGRLGCSDNGGREARVSRYKEKRRTRLFSKKIRYEVRKLNAEKRPRMKGRFVKRTTSFAAGGSSTFPNHIMN